MAQELGIERKIDELGRVVIPKQVRKQLGLETDDKLNVLVEGNRIVISKKGKMCVFCNEENGVSVFKEQYICSKCKGEMEALSKGEVI